LAQTQTVIFRELKHIFSNEHFGSFDLTASVFDFPIVFSDKIAVDFFRETISLRGGNSIEEILSKKATLFQKSMMNYKLFGFVKQ